MLDFKLFHKCLQSMEESNDLIAKYSDVISPEFLDRIAVSWPFLELLESSMNDQTHWIEYWAYEKNFGRDWDEHTASEPDGTPIFLQTARQLYDYLVGNGSNHVNQTSQGGWSNEDYEVVANAYAENCAHAKTGDCHEK